VAKDGFSSRVAAVVCRFLGQLPSFVTLHFSYRLSPRFSPLSKRGLPCGKCDEYPCICSVDPENDLKGHDPSDSFYFAYNMLKVCMTLDENFFESYVYEKKVLNRMDEITWWTNKK
jgi:hypothetical protein